MFDRAHSRRQACQDPRATPRSRGARPLFRKSRCADRPAIARAAVVAIALGVGALGCGGSGGKSPITVRRGRGQTAHLFDRERRRRRRRNARRHVRLRRRLSQRILRRRRLLQHRLHRHVHGLQRPGVAGDLHVRSRGRRATRVEPMSRVGRVHLRPRRHVRRQRRLPEPPRGYGVQGRRLLGGRGRRRQRLRRAGTMQGGAGDDLRALQLRSGDERLRGDLPVERRLRHRRRVRQRQLRPQAAWRHVHQEQRLRIRVLHRRRLLQRRLPRAVRQLQPGGPCRNVLAGRRWDQRSARDLPGQGSRLVRADGRLRRRRWLRDVRRRDDLPRAVLQRRRSSEHGRHLQRPGRVSRARRAGLRAVPVPRRRLHLSLHQRRRVHGGPRVRRERQLRPQAERTAVRRRERLQQQLLRRWGLL